MNGESDVFARLLAKPGLITKQFGLAVDTLGEAIGDKGKAYIICSGWQKQFQAALQSANPDWFGLASFRLITDYTCEADKLLGIVGPKLSKDAGNGAVPSWIEKGQIKSKQDISDAYHLYHVLKKDINSGKLDLVTPAAEAPFLKHLESFDKKLGGQAGNILWLWLTLLGGESDSRVLGFTPYLSKGMSQISGLQNLHLLLLRDGRFWVKPLGALASDSGVREIGRREPHNAPAGGSVVVPKSGRRLIYQFKGIRDLHLEDAKGMPWVQVQFCFGDEPIGPPVERAADDLTWPAINLFCDCYIHKIQGKSTLVVRLATENELVEALGGRADFAILGGIDALFRDPWLNHEKVHGHLVGVASRQIEALAVRCGIRIGVELSTTPSPAYSGLLGRWCSRGLVAALGVNGEDELPPMAANLQYRPSYTGLHGALLSEAQNTGLKGSGFAYITYLRARTLAEAIGVNTLYVHTNSLDFILQRHATPGALLRAQLADMKGKGLVIAALLRKAYGESWDKHLVKIPPTVKPGAMAELARFARDFADHESQGPGQRETVYRRILHSGIWLAPSASSYSVAVVPVMWPPVGENAVPAKRGKKGVPGATAEPELPEKLNSTGAGDMTFGAFFYLGGV
jgi:hypothetical protein